VETLNDLPEEKDICTCSICRKEIFLLGYSGEKQGKYCLYCRNSISFPKNTSKMVRLVDFKDIKKVLIYAITVCFEK